MEVKILLEKRREEGSGWGTHVYLWRIHFDIPRSLLGVREIKTRNIVLAIQGHSLIGESDR